MQVPIWALAADPEDSLSAVRFEDTANVPIAVMVPLALQLRAEAADVCAALLLSCHPISAGCQAASRAQPGGLIQQSSCSRIALMSDLHGAPGGL